MEVRPDHAGYVAAQERLRELLGEPIILLAPIDATYPPGTALDPETGEPYDPLIGPAASAQATTTLRGRVAFRAIKPNDQATAISGALGWMEDADVVAILGSATASAASGAVGMVIRDERYEIRDAKLDGIAGVDRYLVYGAKES